MDESKRSLAIVAWQALPAVFPNLGDRVGGLETAAWMFARGLSMQTSWNPTLVVRTPKALPETHRDGVRIHASVEPWEQWRRDVAECVDIGARRVKRFRGSLLWKLPALVVTRPFRNRDPELMQPDPRLHGLDVDVWIAMGVGRESAGVIATARRKRCPSVLMIRSGADLDERFIEPDRSVSLYGERSDVCRYVLDNADHIVCQTRVQQDLVMHRFGRTSTLIRNPIEIQRWRGNGSDRDRSGVLWVGRFETFAKRIQLAARVASLCPKIPFTFLAGRDDPSVEAQIRASLPANVTVVDYVPSDQMPSQFLAHQAFLSTSASEVEGFPNVNLQAAAAGTPIVSLNDFDGFIRDSGAGQVVDDDCEMAACWVKQFVSGDVTLENERVSDYLQQHHAYESVIEGLDGFLSGVCVEGTRGV